MTTLQKPTALWRGGRRHEEALCDAEEKIEELSSKKAALKTRLAKLQKQNAELKAKSRKTFWVD